jgi:nifR3 family TIM-barrel protein
VFQLNGDVEQGKGHFRRVCSACHRVEGIGTAVGADLKAIRNRGMPAIMLNILDPNREVTPQFLTYVILTSDGRVQTGMIQSESANSITLRRPDNTSISILRIDIDQMRSTGLSFMPEGLEKELDPQAMADAAKYIEQTGLFDWVDLNCGCPVKKVVSRGAGAALMQDLPLLGEIITKVKAAVSLPVAVKTRIGFNNETPGHLEIAKVVEESGADMIAVHARLAKNFHGGDPDWEKLGEMKQALNIPVIGNGGVNSAVDAQRMVEVSGVDGVMIGRGAIGNPWFFEQVRRSADHGQDAHATLEMRRELMAEHLRRLVELNELKQTGATYPHKYSPEEAACIQFRTHIPYYVRGMFDKKQLLMKLAQLMSVHAIMEEVDTLVAKNL